MSRQWLFPSDFKPYPDIADVDMIDMLDVPGCIVVADTSADASDPEFEALSSSSTSSEPQSLYPSSGFLSTPAVQLTTFYLNNKCKNKGFPADWSISYDAGKKKYRVKAPDGKAFTALTYAREHLNKINPKYEPEVENDNNKNAEDKKKYDEEAMASGHIEPFSIPVDISFKTPTNVFILLGDFDSSTPNLASFLSATFPSPTTLILGPVSLLKGKSIMNYSSSPISPNPLGVSLHILRSTLTAMRSACETFPLSNVYFASAGFGSLVAVSSCVHCYENTNRMGFKTVSGALLERHPSNFRGGIMAGFPAKSKTQDWYSLLGNVPAALDLLIVLSSADETTDLQKIEEVRGVECTLLTNVLEGKEDDPFKDASEKCLKKLRRAVNSFTGFEQQGIVFIEGTSVEL